MSYCRFSDADIYVFASDRGFECCGCPSRATTFFTKNAAAMIRHMVGHREDGLYVPVDAIYGVFQDRYEFKETP
jgi:hypothetical protein